MLNRASISLDLFLLFVILSAIASNSALPLPVDAQALLDFKSKADLHNLLLFNASSLHCTWPGVKCASPASDRVVRFVVGGVPLGGVFPADSLTRLDQLRVLSLQNVSLSGPIPDLSALANLKSFFLDHNSFSGDFPPSISSLHRLRTLDFSYNNLSGPIPSWLTRFDRISSLRLEFNRFNGSVPALNQSSLLTFNVSGNNLSGAVPLTAVLKKFGASAYALNPGLCGEIADRECNLKLPHSDPSSAARPPNGAIGQNVDLQGAELAHAGEKRRRYRHHSEVVILGFSVGVLALIASLICVAIGIKRRHRKEKSKSGSAFGVGSAAGDIAAVVAEVMRTEEEREVKVKTVEEGIKAAKSGSLLFFAGEAPPYTVQQLMKASAELLGRGTVGTTYKALLDDSRLIVCVKRLDARKVAGAGNEAFLRHMGLVGGLRHPNLVPLRAYFQEREERLLVYDYQSNGSVFSLIHGTKSARAKPLHWTSCLKIAEDVAQGLSYIHQTKSFVHGNLKSSNVLLGSDFEARLTDYCLTALANNSSLFEEEEDPDSSGYKAPEVLDSTHKQSTKSDVYPFGVLMLELLTGKPPSQHPYVAPKDMMRWMRNTREAMDDDGDEESRLAMLMEVGIACRVKKSEQRPTMWQVLKMLQEIKEAVLVEEYTSDMDD
ncbi:hypothetical protein V2J09_011797 [Rumex salicifolius]